jgi:hypothetical protein
MSSALASLGRRDECGAVTLTNATLGRYGITGMIKEAFYKMYIKLTETILKQFTKKRKQIDTTFPVILRRRLTDFADESVTRMIARFYEPKTGRVYVLEDGGLHIASAEGEAPARITGALMEGIHYDISATSLATTLTLGYDKEQWYGKRLEIPMYRPNIVNEFERINVLTDVLYDVKKLFDKR